MLYPIELWAQVERAQLYLVPSLGQGARRGASQRLAAGNSRARGLAFDEADLDAAIGRAESGDPVP